MLKLALSRNNAILLIVIIVIATSLSILSYQYFAVTSNQVVQIASDDIRSNAITEANDISHSLENKVNSVTSNLYILAHSPSVLSHEYERARNIINAAEDSTNHLTDFYMWLDENGKIVWISNINQTSYQKYKGFDLSYRPYFIVARNTHTPYYSSAIESNDNIPRLYISYPLINSTKTMSNTSSTIAAERFNGVMVAGITTNTVGNLLKNQLLPQSKSSLGLLDKKGIILYSDNSSYIGKYILGDEFQHILSGIISPNSKILLNDLFKRSLLGSSGSGDIILGHGGLYTIAYQPVKIDGNYFLTSYILAPHYLATNVGNLVNQQEKFSIFIMIIIAVVASAVAFFVLSWNKRLNLIINSRTQELRRSNDSLTDSNKQLAIVNEELKNHDKLQKEFINIAAHELRTPIQPILSLTEVLKSKIKDTGQLEMLDAVIRNAKRLRRLAENILDITKIEGKSLQLEKEQFNLHEVILNVVQDYRSQQSENRTLDIQVLSDEPNKAIVIYADKSRIAQVISNLLSNAIKFTKRGTVLITAEKRKDSKEVIVSMKDTGSGLDPEILPRLFSKFATKSSKGTGLGLFISKRIVETHGGKMWAENNNDGKGATFYFSLPILLATSHPEQ
ncbi:MAG TPA: sensor histidine kinase [Candidatus Nitrosopolaris sp.]|nr:sensor histidine kinase [Candidatus Nitrosopolaris sp.]